MSGSAFLIALALAAASPAGAHPSPIRWEAHGYELRSGDTITAEIGALDVPANRRTGSPERITLRFVRLPALAGAEGPPIVYLAGGPGGSGIEAGKGDRSALFERLRAHGDVILLDQRGVGLSEPPPDCSTPWAFPLDQAATEATINASVEAALAACAAEWRAGGVDLDAYDSAESAADVADLIRALGGKAHIVGISYGTHLGFVLLRDHGDLIERAVFAGTEGPGHTTKLPTQADAALAALSREIVENGGSDLEAPVRRVFARLDGAPAVVTRDGGSTQVVSLYDAQVVTAFLMATSENAVRLPALFAEMEAADFSGMAEMVRWLRGFYGALPAMPFATDAAAGTSDARQRAADALTARSLFGNGALFPSADLAGALGIEPLPDRYRAPIESDVPALFISGTLDSRTPPANAEEVRRGFSTSTHLVIDGGGHDNDLFLASPLILDRIDTFLAGRELADERIEVDILALD